MVRCPSCAHETLSSLEFCDGCGTRLPCETTHSSPPNLTFSHGRISEGDRPTSHSTLGGDHRVVTVMFCDITNSTPLAARVGAEAMHGLFNRFFEIALAEVHRYEGTINQFLGDGFMALFGAPIAHEDHARRALLAATAIQQHFRDIDGSDDPLRVLQLRMGLNTGRIVVGKIGDNLRMDYTAIGDTTNLAARLQGIADPDTIRVSESTHRAAKTHFNFKDLGRHALKGIDSSVKVFEP